MRLKIITLPDERLRAVCSQVEIAPETKSLAAGMRELIRGKGLGLAAPQVGRTIRLVVVNVGLVPFAWWSLFNPVITWRSPDQVDDREGCLSDPPTIKDQVVIRRPRLIDLEFTTSKGERLVRRQLGGIVARVLQHELDHLDGINISDRVAGAVVGHPGRRVNEADAAASAAAAAHGRDHHASEDIR